ncbi:hypothetical protein GCM10022262_40870 [Georgenia daeguensis]|uniref:Uncharacterized protein n=1 Tax=Georgenia daeguensis TaxID=908355 RepID=A0ABP6UPP1_9MICO
MSAFHGLTPNSFHTPATVEWSRPNRAASSRLDQCVTPRLSGGGTNVAAITSARSTRRGRPVRDSSTNPLSPRSAYRSRHRFTVGRDTPTRSAITWFPTPSAANSTILARCANDAITVAERVKRSNSSRSPARNGNAGAVLFAMLHSDTQP